MNSYFYHIQINIDFKNLGFYRKLMAFLGWSIIFEKENVIGFKSGKNGDLWFVNCPGKDISDYDSRGVNHISIRVDEKEDVDNVADFLKQNAVVLLFGTPKHRPEFVSAKNETYYQVMFKTMDNILFEVVYIGIND